MLQIVGKESVQRDRSSIIVALREILTGKSLGSYSCTSFNIQAISMHIKV